MSGRCRRFALLSSSTLVWAASCAVFPDEAVLPAGSNSSAGDGGSDDGAGQSLAGRAGQSELPEMNGGAAGAAAVGGAAGEPATPSGGVGGGDGGAGGTPCEEPQQRVVSVVTDTWIHSARPSVTHGADKRLFVAGGKDEQRALLQVGLPASDGARLIKATLTLNLEANEDGSLAARTLSVHRLTRPFAENRASWLNYDSPGQMWSVPGGDFELQQLGSARLPAKMAPGVVSIDVTETLTGMFSDQAVPLSLIILETGTPPTAPSALAFTSTEGDASDPSLVIDFCAP